MTPDQINAAIAIQMVWIPTEADREAMEMWEAATGERIPPHPPHYCRDLNEMHNVIRLGFGSDGYYDRSFVTELCGVLGLDKDCGMLDKRTIIKLLKATDLQLAEAYLRTLGKWIE